MNFTVQQYSWNFVKELEGLHSRFKSAEELEKNRSIEITQAKEQRERMKKNEEILRETRAKKGKPICV